LASILGRIVHFPRVERPCDRLVGFAAVAALKFDAYPRPVDALGAETTGQAKASLARDNGLAARFQLPFQKELLTRRQRKNCFFALDNAAHVTIEGPDRFTRFSRGRILVLN